jgi:amino acid adenylation domain-containing protein
VKFLIHQLLTDTLSSGAVAIEHGSAKIKYYELDSKIRIIQQWMVSIGLSKGDRIGILSRVHEDAISTMIAALRLGIVYIPLNIHAPEAWVSKVLIQSGVKAVVAQPEFCNKISNLIGLSARATFGASISDCSWTNFDSLNDVDQHLQSPNILSDDLAYILYTSGSTGEPKGIMISHRNAVTFIDWMAKEFKLFAEDRVFSRAPLQFDLSVFDIFSTLMVGATLVIAPLEESDSPNKIVEFMREQKISIVYTVPSALISLLMKGNLERDIPTLRQVLYAGEPFNPAFLRRFMNCLPGTKVANIYGPTETNIVTCYHVPTEFDGTSAVPIGSPVQDTEAYIVDEQFNIVPEGELGQIMIRGSTVFLGYFENQELTKQRLIQSPFHSYTTLCCLTGDYGRLLPDGNIQYHGRMDSMIKTRGYRVELGEVEAAIACCSGVKELAAVPIPNDKYGSAIIAFVELTKETSTDLVKNQLEDTLPSYMVPFKIYQEEELPRTSTGKIDRVTLLKRAKSYECI